MWGWRLCSVTVRYGAPRCNIENFTVCRICVTCSTLSVGFSKMGIEQCLRSVFLLYWSCDYPTLHEDSEDLDFIDAAEGVECLDQDKGLWFLPQGKTCAFCWQVPFVPMSYMNVVRFVCAESLFSHHHQVSKRNKLSKEKLVLARSFSILYTYIATLRHRGFMRCV